MPTTLNESNLSGLGETTDADKIEKTVNKADTTLASVERIAGKVENILGMITKFKEMGKKKDEAPVSVAPKIEKGIEKGVLNKTEQMKQTTKIKVDVNNVKKELELFLNTLGDDKTIKEVKKELKELDKLGMTQKAIQDYVNKNCKVVFE